MNREETIKLLSILKAAYPNSYKGMTKDEANGTISVWSMQFSNIPGNIVLLAVNKLVGTSPFPPAISEVKRKLVDIHYEALEMLREHSYATEGYKFAPDAEPVYYGKALDEKTLRFVRGIVDCTETLKCGKEESLEDMLTIGAVYYLPEGTGK